MTIQSPSPAARSGPLGSLTLRRMFLLALIVGVLAAASAWLVTPARAYIGENPYTVRLEGPGRSVRCSDAVTITASVKDAKTHANVGQQFVLWSLTEKPSNQDAVKPARTATGDDGMTSVTLTFGAVTGARKVQAMVADFPAYISVTCNTGVTYTPTPVPGKTPKSSHAPGTTDAPGTTNAPGTTPAPGESPVAGASGPIGFETTSPALPTIGAGGAGSASPGATLDPGTSHDADAGGGGIASAVVLVGGLVILGAVAGLLWFVLRRRPPARRPPAAR